MGPSADTQQPTSRETARHVEDVTSEEIADALRDTREDVSEVGGDIFTLDEVDFGSLQISPEELKAGMVVNCKVETKTGTIHIDLTIGEKLHPLVTIYKVSLPENEEREELKKFLGADAILNFFVSPPVLSTNKEQYEIFDLVRAD